MKDSTVRRVVIFGGLAILGILAAQSYWLLKTWDLKEKEFDQTVNIALRNVASYIAKYNDTELPKKNLIQRRSSNYYAVNVNSKIDANILEDYLYQEIGNMNINTDFEYAVYDCLSDDLVYGSYCRIDPSGKEHKMSESLPKFDDLVYYFVVKFPERQSYVLSNLKTNLIFAAIAILSTMAFVYSIFVILRQKRLSDLQKDFINNMTHEFKTPIASIKIASSFLTKEDKIVGDNRLAKYANIIFEQNERLNNQVEKVLNVARLDNEGLKLKMEELELIGLVRKIVDAEQIKMGDGIITFNTEIEHFFVQGDRLHITNVLHNILDNAVKYCKEEPRIEISTKKEGPYFSLSIRDNGIGISRENLRLIFNKFFRVSTGNIHDVKGFGLGLYYVYQICKSHGWNIDVTSKEGVGSNFIILIPIKKSKNE